MSIARLISHVSLQAVVIVLAASTLFARTIENDPLGFYGMKWGDPIAPLPGLEKVETDGTIEIYILKTSPPMVGDIPVDSIKFTTIEGKLAKVTIRYHGEDTHQSLMDYLETRFGRIELPPGSLMRGLSQQYSWRGAETQISVTFRGFRQQGYLFAESRILAPLFMDAIPEHSF